MSRVRAGAGAGSPRRTSPPKSPRPASPPRSSRISPPRSSRISPPRSSSPRSSSPRSTLYPRSTEMKDLESKLERMNIQDKKEYSETNPLLASLLGEDTRFLPLVSLISEYTEQEYEFYEAYFSYNSLTGIRENFTILLKLEPGIARYFFERYVSSSDTVLTICAKKPELRQTRFCRSSLQRLKIITEREFYERTDVPKVEINKDDIKFNFKEKYQGNEKYAVELMKQAVTNNNINQLIYLLDELYHPEYRDEVNINIILLNDLIELAKSRNYNQIVDYLQRMVNNLESRYSMPNQIEF
jgi:hypothetical protein